LPIEPVQENPREVPDSLAAAACWVLHTADAHEKAVASQTWAEKWQARQLPTTAASTPPEFPARPSRPILMSPKDMPRRRSGGEKGRIALLHALAHIELNAIDLAWDLIARFDEEDWPPAFFDDWVQVAHDEARHFQLLAQRLDQLGTSYGDLPAHNSMWEAAHDTRHDALARLAIVPLVLEARALDVTPAMIDRVRRSGDEDSALIIELIASEEIAHVAAGWRWFSWLCEGRDLVPTETYAGLVKKHLRATLKLPFNKTARSAAGLPPELYQDLVID
jgi:uncharacterized ferritin-like protein (DUF455 family)